MKSIGAVLLPGLILGAAGVGFVLLALHKRARTCRRLGRLSSASLAALAIGLAAQAGGASVGRMRWIPGLEPAGFTLHAPGIYLAMLTFWALPTSQFIHWIDAPPDRRPTVWPGLAHILCALVAAALTVDHFVARLALLDLVAVCLLIALFLELGNTQHSPITRDRFPLIRRYVLFRAGDIGLLVLALLLWIEGGTFIIADALLVAPLLSPVPRLVAVAGGMLAVAVKLGLPPFHGWVAEVSKLGLGRRVFLLGATLPLLGAYLLYRLRPLLAAAAAAPALAVVGTLLLARSLLSAWHGRRSPTALTTWLQAAHGSLGLLLVTTPIMQAYLLSFLPLRAGVLLAVGRSDSKDSASAPAENACRLLGRVAVGLASAMREVERVALDGSARGLAATVVGLASWTSRRIELGALEGLIQHTIWWLGRLSTLAQAQHNGRLRRYLLWATATLLILLMVTLSWHAG